MIVVIDDERTFDGHVDVYARNSLEGLGILAKVFTNQTVRYADPIEVLYLDHDLGGEDTIRPVVDFLLAMKGEIQIDRICVHSQNPTTDWIVRSLSKFYVDVERIPLPQLKV